MKMLGRDSTLNCRFFLGFILGLCFTVLIQWYGDTRFITTLKTPSDTKFITTLKRPSDTKFITTLKTLPSDTSKMRGSDLEFDDTLAQDLYRSVRVLCWIPTSPTNLDLKAKYVKETWTKRCNLRLFMSSVKNTSFPTIGLNTSEGRQHLTAKTMQAFKYIYDHHFEDADWFLKADDDTYVVMENLRYFLSGQDTESPLYFGQRFRPHVKSGYASGGAGYVLSKEGLRRFGAKIKENPAFCHQDLGSEDVKFGICMERLGVKLKSSLDAKNRSRFHYYKPEIYIRGLGSSAAHHKYNGEGGDGGMENMSDYTISFHKVAGTRMYEMEFYTYHLRPYGIIYPPLEMNRPREGKSSRPTT